MKQLNINPVFRDLIQPLTAEEFQQLEDNVLADGIRDAIVVWNDTIIDGHNRYQLAQTHGLTFAVHEVNFESEDHAVLWIIDNQMGRRNLTDFVKLELEEIKNDTTFRIQGINNMSMGAINRGFAGNQYKKVDGLSIMDKPSKTEPVHNTQKKIAESLNWGTGKVARGQYVIKHAPEEVKQQLRAGDLSMNEAYNAVKKQERSILIEEQKQAIIENKLPELSGLYEVISVDPPWNYGREFDPNSSRVANPYPEMTVEQIKAINLPFTQNAILFLWTTHKFLPDAFEVLKHWQFEYKATLVWNKEKIGMGSWFRMQCEFCLFAIKGKPLWDNSVERDIITESRREHSRKPDAFFDMVNRICYGRKLEYFSREKRDGWEVFGNDINKF